MKTIQEIAYEIGTSKQNVNQILKRAMRKLYNRTKKILGESWNPFESVLWLAKIFEIDQEKDLHNLFQAFPDDIKKEIWESSKKFSF